MATRVCPTQVQEARPQLGGETFGVQPDVRVGAEGVADLLPQGRGLVEQFVEDGVE